MWWSSRFTQTPNSFPSMASEWIPSASTISVAGSDVIRFPEVPLLVLPGKLFSNRDHTIGRTKEVWKLEYSVLCLRSQLLSHSGLRRLYSDPDTFLTHQRSHHATAQPRNRAGASRVTLYEDDMSSVLSINLDRK